MKNNITYAVGPSGRWYAYRNRNHAEAVLLPENREAIIEKPEDIVLYPHLKVSWSWLESNASRILVDGKYGDRVGVDRRRAIVGTAYIFTKYADDQAIKAVGLPKQCRVMLAEVNGQVLTEIQLEAAVRNCGLKTKQDPMRIFRYYKKLLVQKGCLKLTAAE
jgi:hypothetical protein